MLENDIKNEDKKELLIKDKKEETQINQTKQVFKSVSYFKLQFSQASCLDILFIFLGFLGSMITGVSMPAFSFVFGQSFNTIMEDTYNKPKYLKDMEKMSIEFAVLGGITMLSGWLMIACWTYAGKNISLKIKEDYFKTILSQEQGYFDQINSFEFSTKVQGQTKDIDQGIGEKVGNLIMASSMFVLSFLICFLRSWKLTLVLAIMLPFLAICGYFIALLLQKSEQYSAKAFEKAGGAAEETLYSIKTVASFSNFEYENSKFNEFLKESMETGIKNGLKTGLGFAATFFMMYATYALAIWYGSILIADDITQKNGVSVQSGVKVGEVLTVLLAFVFGALALGNATPNLKAISKACASAQEYFYLKERAENREKELKARDSKKIESDKIQGKISFVNVNFSYPSNPEKQILKNLNLEIEKGKTIAIVGESGSGKSTIVSLIERFYEIEDGSIELDGINIKEIDIKQYRDLLGYVGQEPVLFNTTIRNNLLFGRENITDQQIEDAIEKAYVNEFIKKIDKRLEYVVGIKGSKLSGGQKQRIAIARAILNRPKILILDEATSALDNKSEKEIQASLENVSQGVTTIIIAHRLSTIINADKIVVLSQGQVVEQGKHAELMEMNGYYTALVKNQVQEEVKNDDVLNQSSKSLQNRVSVSARNSQIDLAEVKEVSVNKQEEEKLFKESRSKLLGMLKNNKLTIFFSGVFAAISGMVWPVYGLLLVIAIFDMENPIPSKLKHTGLMNGISFLVLGAVAAIGLTFQQYFFSRIGELLTFKLRKQLFEKYTSIHISFFDYPQNSPGALLTKLSSDTTKINGIALSMIGVTVQTIFCLAIGLGIGFYYEWRSSLIMVGMIPLIILNSSIGFKLHKGFMEGDQLIEIEAGSVLSESVINTKTIFSFNNEKNIIDLYSTIIRKKSQNLMRNSILIGLVFGISQTILFAVFAILNYAGAEFYYHGWVTNVESMNKAIFAILLSAFGLGQAQQYVGDLTKAREALLSIFKVLNTQSEIDPTEKIDKVLPSDIKGKIEFRNVNFAYPSRPNQLIFKDLSFVIQPGQSVAFVGFSGSGKSTIIQLIERFYDPLSGDILIDDINIKEYQLGELRKNIGLVLQEPTLFKRNVIENIRYGKLQASDEDVVEASKKAYISNIIQGDNENVSGGQKQRIAIARAILKDPKILLLDEATSALDKNSEEIVQKALDNLMVKRTSIVVAHRLSTIVNCDCIYVMDAGKIIEKGNHEELINRKKAYYNLYNGTNH